MKIIFGLGNPGEEYQKTRHNLGFITIDKLSDMLEIEINKEKLSGFIGTGKYNGEKIVLVKPKTYMNLSGDCVLKVMKFYKAELQDIIVIYDDIDVEVGKIRVKPNGSSGTHNGMRDISKKLDSTQFYRVRIGSGRPTNGQDLADYVLSKIKKSEEKDLNNSTTNGAKAVIEILENGIASAMNKYN